MDQNLVRMCPVCGSPIPERTHGGGNPKQFCSEKCRRKQADARRYQRHKKEILANSREYRLENAEAARARGRRWQKENRERIAAATRRYAERHPERVRQQYKRWYAANPDVVAHRRAMKAQATPPWLTDKQRLEIQRIYDRCRTTTAKTGIAHHVDHIYPLSGATSCGLHVPWNLQILTQAENQRKSNAMPEAA